MEHFRLTLELDHLQETHHRGQAIVVVDDRPKTRWTVAELSEPAVSCALPEYEMRNGGGARPEPRNDEMVVEYVPKESVARLERELELCRDFLRKADIRIPPGFGK